MKVLQVLPALNSGGVERGTVEFARELVKAGHQSLVLSSGGQMVAALEEQGTTHVTMPVHRKSLASFAQVRPVRRLIEELAPDVIHVRSRIPAWIVWLAWRKLPVGRRPALVSTFHGMYSVSPYSAIMAKPPHLIAISQCVKHYILDNYGVDPARITVIQRGVDRSTFYPREPQADWLAALYQQYPQLAGKQIVLMPGRLTRWKGQEAFLQMMLRLREQCPDVHGVVVGGAEPKKAHYQDELLALNDKLGLADTVTFVGQRGDIAEFYRLADTVCHMSSRPEPFGRTLTEALAVGTRVVAYDRGGASESLSACYPEGLVPADDLDAFVSKVADLLGKPAEISMAPEFELPHQVNTTLAVYQLALAEQGQVAGS